MKLVTEQGRPSTAQNDIIAYIEGFYNTLRPHSAIGWIAPKTLSDKKG